MSLDTCEQCGEFINTDESPEVYRGDSLSCVCDLCWESGASQSIAGVYSAYYEMLTKAEKSRLTKFVNFLKENVDYEDMAKALGAIMLGGGDDMYKAKELNKGAVE